MIKKIGLAFAALLGVVLIVAAFQPSEYTITRELLLPTTAEKAFPYLNEARKMDEWMPWKDSDPSVQMTYSGPEVGPGSTSSWTSTGRMGIGKATIMESATNEKVVTEITYSKPMEMQQVSTMSLKAGTGGTVLTWSVSGKNAYINKLMSLFFNVDAFVGGEFLKGMEKLKAILAKA